MPDSDEIWQAQLDMYDGFLRGDRAQIDRHIADDATLWDSEEPDLAIGKSGLDEVRARRPADGPKVADLQATLLQVDVWGDTAVSRHNLYVTFADGTPAQRVRNTGVWRRRDGQWLVVHNHEDVLAD
jgi:ketosteroid isomerase-like protein